MRSGALGLGFEFGALYIHGVAETIEEVFSSERMCVCVHHRCVSHVCGDEHEQRTLGEMKIGNQSICETCRCSWIEEELRCE